MVIIRKIHMGDGVVTGAVRVILNTGEDFDIVLGNSIETLVEYAVKHSLRLHGNKWRYAGKPEDGSQIPLVPSTGRSQEKIAKLTADNLRLSQEIDRLLS